MKGKANKGDFVLGACYRPPNHDEEADEVFYKQLAEVSQSPALVLVGDFNLLDICWKYNTAESRQARRFLECMEDNFLMQLVSEPTRGGSSLDLLLTNREGLVGDVVVGGCLVTMCLHVLVTMKWSSFQLLERKEFSQFVRKKIEDTVFLMIPLQTAGKLKVGKRGDWSLELDKTDFPSLISSPICRTFQLLVSLEHPLPGPGELAVSSPQWFSLAIHVHSYNMANHDMSCVKFCSDILQQTKKKDEADMPIY
ncbi:hypothetical protein llap_3441 [Limosa lapponica baueri]|uniref:Endonuclease/exonuclease/phosphatase domain-containing protein n=1 Tax=Limosa lapponica baueri TaxID=1758121 RepID=A0A2I0UJI0_LIMLA|nr:hypothetical protein llap_3441 [Limosa lapponica baueri]